MYETNRYNGDYIDTISIPSSAIVKNKQDGNIYCTLDNKRYQLEECNTRKFLWDNYKSLFITYGFLILISLVLLKSVWLTFAFILIEFSIYYFFEIKKKRFTLKLLDDISRHIRYFIIAQVTLLFIVGLFNFTWIVQYNTLISDLFVLNIALYSRSIILYLTMKFKKVYRIISDKNINSFYIWKSL